MTKPDEAMGLIERLQVAAKRSCTCRCGSPNLDQHSPLCAKRCLIDAVSALNTPEVEDFTKGVMLEAPHQRMTWGASHDAGKSPADWFWLIGYLAQKAMMAALSGNIDKAKHHCISTAAALANWHAALSGTDTSMRPGIDPVARGIEAAE